MVLCRSLSPKTLSITTVGRTACSFWDWA